MNKEKIKEQYFGKLTKIPRYDVFRFCTNPDTSLTCYHLERQLRRDNEIFLIKGFFRDFLNPNKHKYIFNEMYRFHYIRNEYTLNDPFLFYKDKNYYVIELWYFGNKNFQQIRGLNILS